MVSPPGGSHEGSVQVNIRSPDGGLVHYTLDGSPPNYASNTVRDGGHLVVSAQGETRVRLFARVPDMRDSDEVVVTFVVTVKPPVGAFAKRTRAAMEAGMHDAYHAVAEAQRETHGRMVAAQFLEFFLRLLNPDDGRCAECFVSAGERAEMRRRVAAFAESEGFHSEREHTAEVVHGFMTRGNALLFAMDLSQHMRHYRADAGTRAAAEAAAAADEARRAALRNDPAAPKRPKRERVRNRDEL